MNAKRAHEKTLFELFLNAQPTFAGEALQNWRQPDDEKEFPDVKGTTVSGKRVGVEIGEWLNEKEMAAAKSNERLEESFSAAIGEQGTNPTGHVGRVWLHPKPHTRILPSRFREQLFDFIHECDARWPTEHYWQRGASFANRELSSFPLLAQHLDAIKLWARRDTHAEVNWITFPNRGNWFDQNTMLEPLRRLLRDKLTRYGSSRTGFDFLALLIIYNLALLYNSPAETPFHTYEDTAKAVEHLVHEHQHPFHSVYLFIATENRVIQIA